MIFFCLNMIYTFMYKTYEYECRVYKEYMWKDIEEKIDVYVS